MIIRTGDRAPDVTLRDTANKEVTLSEVHQEHVVVLAFFYFAFSGG